MKKLLALVLALVMSMSLVTISNAAFSDVDKIDHKEAVEVMNALGVINGMPDGSFAPAGNVTRAEMAKMITIIMLGDIDAAAFKGTATDLTDINGHWAEGYIKYCYSQGVIAGRGDGTFAPNANVTAVEAAKMLLVAIGYNSDVQGYVGADWSINVIRDAQLSKFFDKLSVASTKVLTRDEAAQMIYNAINAKMIKKEPSISITNGNITYSYKQDATKTLLKETFGADVYVGVLATVDYADTNKKYTYTANTDDFENKANSSVKIGSFKSKVDYSALKGEEISVIQKTENNGDKTVLGAYATGKSTVITVAQSTLDSSDKKLKVNGEKWAIDSSANFTLSTAVKYESYDLVKLIDVDGDGDLDTMIVTATNPTKVAYVSTSEIIAGGTTYKYADNKIADGIAKKDYVTVVKMADGSYTIEKLTAVEGVIEATKTSNGDEMVRVAGVWYNDSLSTSHMGLGNTYKFYAVNGVVVKDSATQLSGATIENLVMIVAADNAASVMDAKAKVIDSTGATKVVSIDATGDGVMTATEVKAAVGKLATFEQTNDGYRFKAAQNLPVGATGSDIKFAVKGTTSSTVAITSGTTATMTDSGTAYTVADTAVIYVKCSDGAAVINGKQLKSMTADASAAKTIKTTGSTFFVSESNGLSRVTYAAVEFNGKVNEMNYSGGNSLYGYVTVASYATKVDGVTYAKFTMWTGSEYAEVMAKGDTSYAKGAIVKYDAITDGVVSGISTYTVTNTLTNDPTSISEVAAVRGIDGKYIYLDSTDETNKVKLVTDTAYLYVDSNAAESTDIGVAAGEIALADKYAGVYMDNVIVVTNASDEAVLVVVDVKNNMTNSNTGTLIVTNSSNKKVDVSKANSAKVKLGDSIEIKNNEDSNVTITLTGIDVATNDYSSPITLAAGNSITVFVESTSAPAAPTIAIS